MPPRSRSTVRAAVGVAAVAVLTTACGGPTPTASRAFCIAAERYDDELARQARRGEVDVDRQVARVAALAAEAPRAIRAEAEAFLAYLRAVEDSPGLRDRPRVRRVVDDVNRFANQACGVYDRNPGGL